MTTWAAARWVRSLLPGEPTACPDPETYAELTRPLQSRLFRMACCWCADQTLAADLTQEALLRGFESFDRFHQGAPLLPWLARIMRNLYLDQVRSLRHRKEVLTDTLPEVSSGAQTPLCALLSAETRQLLRNRIAAMPANLALTLVLFDIEGLSYEEIATQTAVPVGTVRSRLSRARENLRKTLVEHQPEVVSELLRLASHAPVGR